MIGMTILEWIFIELDNNLFPELTWKDCPLEVTLIKK